MACALSHTYTWLRVWLHGQLSWSGRLVFDGNIQLVLLMELCGTC